MNELFIFIVWPPVILQHALYPCVFQPVSAAWVTASLPRLPAGSWQLLRTWLGASCLLTPSFYWLLCCLIYQFPNVTGVKLLYILSKMPRPVWLSFLVQLLVLSGSEEAAKGRCSPCNFQKSVPLLADAWKLLAEAFCVVTYGY